MKNKFYITIFSLFLNLCYFNQLFAEEFTFQVSEIEITNNGNIYKGIKRGDIVTNNGIKLISDNFKYQKKINQLEAFGNVKLIDTINDIIIDAENIVYLKDEEKIFTVGKTKIIIEKKYTINGSNIILLRDKLLLSSLKQTIINDKINNLYTLNEFEYSIDKEVLKGKNVEIITNYLEQDSNEFFFETAFIDLKNNKFLSKDVKAKFNKSLFGNKENDPRLNAATAYGDEFNTYFERGIFTSCKNNDKCPPWKIKSKKIRHDKVKKQIIYKDAWLEIYDFPVAYFPKFFHPDPSVTRQSGFLSPALGSSGNLGSSIYTPYFHVMSDNKDITIKPRIFGADKFVLQNEFRQKSKKSFSIVDFSFAKGHDSSLDDKKDNRTHFFLKSFIDLDLEKFLTSKLDIQFEKVSNDNYLKVFNLTSPLIDGDNDVLESIIKLELESEDYYFTTSLEQYETLAGLNNDRYQHVLPNFNFIKDFNVPNLNGSFNFNTNGSNTLTSTNNLSTVVSNDLQFNSYNKYFDTGIKSNYGISIKNMNTLGKKSTLYKNSAQSNLMTSYIFNTSLPLMKNNEKSINYFEPKLSFKFNPHNVKNNNTLKRTIDMNNIYNDNRLALDNSLEGGDSLTIGFDFKKNKITSKNDIKEIEDFLELKMATVFRNKEEASIPQNSTLNKKKSNIFGQLNYTVNSIFSMNYDFSIKDDLNTIEYSSLDTIFDFHNFRTQFNFLQERGVMGNTDVLENKTKYNFDETNSLSFSTRRNRNLNLTEYYDLIYEYKNDCLIAGIQYKKNYYNDADIKPVEELFFSITLIPLATFSPDKMILK